MMSNETLYLIHSIIVCTGWIPLMIACMVYLMVINSKVTIGQIITVIFAVFYIFSIVFYL